MSNSAPQNQVSENRTADSAEEGSATQSAGSYPDPQNVVIFKFGVLSPTNSEETSLSARACTAAAKATEASAGKDKPSSALDVDPKILSGIIDELQNRLSKRMSVTVDSGPEEILAGSLIVTGCITRIDTGNATKRLIGMNVGASRIGAHVIVLSKTNAGLTTVDSFDIQVKGGDALPPLGPVGLAIHAARDPGQTLSADAKKLADQLLKRLAKDKLSHEPQA
ncbi:DUF4410 domain-containing protein [Granulicella sp. S156]|uniref:DUF4410 domain-containing protein n=1 Tax=Granulicella sp. S156 TaxID=1747224 RepID=UPI00131AB710|nr:DUF4410 domain-containing protein [Granulicella sp. S156]